MKEPVLLVMAAGLGSRYGGMKQIDPVGPTGEIIIDYSLYDAAKAGFKEAVFIIKEENLQDFQELLLPRAGQYMNIRFVFQRMEDIPPGEKLPKNRKKPWGTGQAVLCAADAVSAPFVVINADDFYGREAFEQIYHFLKNTEDTEKYQYAMVGFLLKNTVTEHGFVSRGVCETEAGYLTGIVERTRIEKRDNGLSYLDEKQNIWYQLLEDTIVSMNFWGFTPSIFEALRSDYKRFFQTDVAVNPEKAEFFLPFVVDDLLKQNRAQVEVLSSADQWYGVTYQADKPLVQEAILKMIEQGKYPRSLWHKLDS